MCPPDIGLYLQYKRNQPQAQTKLIIKTWNYPNENQSDYQDMIIRRQDFISTRRKVRWTSDRMRQRNKLLRRNVGVPRQLAAR